MQAAAVFEYPGTSKSSGPERDQLARTAALKSVNESTIVASASAEGLHDEAVKAAILGVDAVSRFLRSAKYETVDELR